MQNIMQQYISLQGPSHLVNFVDSDSTAQMHYYPMKKMKRSLPSHRAKSQRYVCESYLQFGQTMSSVIDLGCAILQSWSMVNLLTSLPSQSPFPLE